MKTTLGVIAAVLLASTAYVQTPHAQTAAQPQQPPTQPRQPQTRRLRHHRARLDRGIKGLANAGDQGEPWSPAGFFAWIGSLETADNNADQIRTPETALEPTETIHCYG